MSSITSFCLFNKKDLNEFVEVLGLPIKTRSRAALMKHPLSKFRSSKTIELVEYRWTGYVFAFELPAFLKTRSIEWSDYAAKAPSAKISKAMDQPVDVFATPTGQKLASALDDVLDERGLDSQIEKFLKKYPKGHMRSDPKLPPAAVFDAMLILRHWVGRVAPSQYGLLEMTC